MYIGSGSHDSRVSRRNRVLLTVGAVVTLSIGLRAAYAFSRFSQMKRQFPSVQIGDTRASVMGKMGKPNYHSGPCGVIHFPDKSCAKEYVYSHPFAPLVPEYYIVAFSSDDRVIEAPPWSSP